MARDPDYTHVSICARWDSFTCFLQDMGEQPSDKTLDRINNYKPYSKENCRWAGKYEQARNKTNTLKYDYHGELKTLSEISELTGIKYKTLFSRISMYGWDTAKAISTPVKQTRRHHTF